MSTSLGMHYRNATITNEPYTTYGRRMKGPCSKYHGAEHSAIFGQVCLNPVQPARSGMPALCGLDMMLILSRSDQLDSWIRNKISIMTASEACKSRDEYPPDLD
jgi:hypothetical protein